MHPDDRWKKLDIPMFSGNDTYVWINKWYFPIKETIEEEVLMVMVALEERALGFRGCYPNQSWEGFKVAPVRRFQPSMA